ncbi:MAG: hypothetical protein M3O31_11050 [Acidobacteriota bacterium]|nr:hypothetical protein [Acidobacteriota bacterium]
MPCLTPRWTASQLRRDLTVRAAQYARAHTLLHDLSAGSDPAIIFGREEPVPGRPARHGNFLPAAYAAICANSAWLSRLTKPHTASRRSSARHDWRWMELDSASSSDALLMNIFCHPEVFDGSRLATPVAALLNVDPAAIPCFGARPGVPLRTPLKPRSKNAAPQERLDRTEIDLTLVTSGPALFLEAKLTESGFQTAAPTLIERYRDLESVFDPDRLPRKVLAPPPLPPNLDPDDPTVNLPARPTRVRIDGYQLIRNVLAAYAADASFCVLLDARRRDLIESWYDVLSSVNSPTFATRLKLLTWQELAAKLPADLQEFLGAKYGIVP